MIRHGRERMLIKAAAARLGFRVLNLRPYLQKVPGAPANLQWYEIRLGCPCGRSKALHIRRDSLTGLDAELEDHLRRDGLLT